MDSQIFYVVDPEKLNFAFEGQPLQWRRDRLRFLLRESASQWASVRSRAADFLSVVTQLGSALGKGEELPDLSFENALFDTLPLGTVQEYDPYFGYFPPKRVTEYNDLFSSMSQASRRSFEERDDGGLAGRILHAFRSSFEEAVARGRSSGDRSHLDSDKRGGNSQSVLHRPALSKTSHLLLSGRLDLIRFQGYSANRSPRGIPEARKAIAESFVEGL